MTWNSILLDLGEGDSKVELQNITFFHLIKFFFFTKCRGQLWVLQQSLVWIIHWRAPEPWESSSTCVDYWRFYFFSSYLQVKKDGLFVCGLPYSSCLNLLKAKQALFALVCCGANYYNTKCTGNTIRFLTINTGPTNIIHFNNPIIKVLF